MFIHVRKNKYDDNHLKIIQEEISRVSGKSFSGVMIYYMDRNPFSDGDDLTGNIYQNLHDMLFTGESVGKLNKWSTTVGLFYSAFYSGTPHEHLDLILQNADKPLTITQFIEFCVFITQYPVISFYEHCTLSSFSFSGEFKNLAIKTLKYLYSNHPWAFENCGSLGSYWLLVSHPEELENISFARANKSMQRMIIESYPHILKRFTLEQIQSKFTLNGIEWHRLLFRMRDNRHWKQYNKPIVVPEGMLDWVEKSTFTAKLVGGDGNKRVTKQRLEHIVEVS